MTTQSAMPAQAATMPGKLHHAEGDAARTVAYLPAATVQSHASNLIALDNGDVLCAWFGGTQEGVPDISIYLSRLAKGSSTWTDPVRLSDDPTRSEQNPVLFAAPDGQLWLMYTAQLSGHQNTSIVRRRDRCDLYRSLEQGSTACGRAHLPRTYGNARSPDGRTRSLDDACGPKAARHPRDHAHRPPGCDPPHRTRTRAAHDRARARGGSARR